MNIEDPLERITINPRVMIGKPVIRGTRLTVEYILKLLAHGITREEILAEYPGLAKDDVHADLLFVSKTPKNASFYSPSDRGRLDSISSELVPSPSAAHLPFPLFPTLSTFI